MIIYAVALLVLKCLFLKSPVPPELFDVNTSIITLCRQNGQAFPGRIIPVDSTTPPEPHFWIYQKVSF